MIDRNLHPQTWADFMYELEDALDHLKHLVQDIERDAGYHQEGFAVDLGHVYAHLNRAWSLSKNPEAVDDRKAASAFPADLIPVG